MKTAMHKAGAVSILVVCCEQGLQGGSAALYWDSETGVRPPRPTGGLPTHDCGWRLPKPAMALQPSTHGG